MIKAKGIRKIIVKKKIRSNNYSLRCLENFAAIPADKSTYILHRTQRCIQSKLHVNSIEQTKIVLKSYEKFTLFN